MQGLGLLLVLIGVLLVFTTWTGTTGPVLKAIFS